MMRETGNTGGDFFGCIDMLEQSRQLSLSYKDRLRQLIRPRAFQNLAEIFFPKKRTGKIIPPMILISPTMRCNLRCEGCFAGECQQEEMESSILRRVIREALDLGISFFSVIGGEPLLREDLLDIFRDFPEAYFQVFTNGTLMTAAIANNFAEMENVLAMVSVNGPEKLNDSVRGQGTFRKVIDAMNFLHAARAPFGFSATITRENMRAVTAFSFVDLMIEMGAVYGWFFNYIPVGRNPKPDLLLSADERIYLGKRIRVLRAKKPIMTIAPVSEAGFAGGCIAGGKGLFHINNRGDCEPCFSIPLATHNIKTSSLGEILQSPFFRAIRSELPCSGNHLAPCLMLDHPELLQKIVRETQARAVYPGADNFLMGSCFEMLTQKAREARTYLDLAWEKMPHKPGSCLIDKKDMK